MRPNLTVFCAACGKSGRPMARTLPFCSSRCRILAARRGVYLNEDSVRFDAKCEPEGDCVLFRGTINKKGYGVFYVGRFGIYAHVFAWVRVNGAVPDGLEMSHLCHRPACVSVLHLVPSTHQENMRLSLDDGRLADGYARVSAMRRQFPERFPHGERMSNAKLSDEAAAEIMRRYTRGSRENGCVALAREFGVSHETVRAVVIGRTWKHVKASA